MCKKLLVFFILIAGSFCAQTVEVLTDAQQKRNLLIGFSPHLLLRNVGGAAHLAIPISRKAKIYMAYNFHREEDVLFKDDIYKPETRLQTLNFHMIHFGGMGYFNKNNQRMKGYMKGDVFYGFDGAIFTIDYKKEKAAQMFGANVATGVDFMLAKIFSFYLEVGLTAALMPRQSRLLISEDTRIDLTPTLTNTTAQQGPRDYKWGFGPTLELGMRFHIPVQM